jgi:hypothetical protein
MTKRYFITSIVPGAEVHRRFVGSIQTFCKKMNAELILMPTMAPVDRANDKIDDEIIDSGYLLTKDRYLNLKIRVSDLMVSPTAVDPVAGLQRQSQKDGSFIFASPKQRLKVIPNGSHVKMPHALMTPGAITYPYYKDNKVGRIAFQDHVIGGIIVEITSNVQYHFRQVQADHINGSFIDLGIEYSESGTKKVKTEALVPGDYHAGEHDPSVKKSILDLQKLLKPKYTVLHDFFNGKSINRHEMDKKASRSHLGNYLSLEYELKVCYDEMADLVKNANEVLVVRSNHDLWIDSWIEGGLYIEDPINYRIGHQLAIAKHDGIMPFEHGVRMFDKNKKLNKVKFLRLGDDLRITPKKIQVAAHGHQGANGSRGSVAVIEKTYGESITGHTHSPEILRGALVTGTSTYLNLAYNEGGASSWLQAHGVVYYNGNKQLIIVINGKWRG